MERAAPGRLFLALRIAAGGAVLVGLAMVFLAVTVGDCSAFGGRCPSEPTPLFEDDVFGTAAFGGFLASAPPAFAWRPSRRRAAVALAIGAGAGLLVGLIARSIAGS